MTPLKGIKMRITINEKEYESGRYDFIASQFIL